ncbi:MAG: hypothetical protein PHP07_05735 [Eubacteriales bacterium]|nr:hypothetical protein [Eubacteriales bacterium]MDD4134461.1 hypothetical protein [Eubacteriales bacterium]
MILDHGALLIEGSFEMAPQMNARCPAGFRMRLSPIPQGLEARLHLYGKAANRKPEALFLYFSMEDAAEIRVRKIYQWINPATAVEDGNRRVHGMDDLLWTGRDGRRLKISLPDALPASLGSPERLDFGGDIIYDTAFMNICIILWGTNFKMWYEEDILRCFIIETPAEKAEQGVHQSYLSSGCARARKRWYCASHVASFRGR